jgi:hypothetical protein
VQVSIALVPVGLLNWQSDELKDARAPSDLGPPARDEDEARRA